MKMQDLFSGCNRAFRSSEPTFETRLLYAQLANPYDCNCDSKYGYLAGAEECLDSYKPIEELEDYINEFEASQDTLDEYDTSYCQAYKDFIKQEKMKNEGSLEGC